MKITKKNISSHLTGLARCGVDIVDELKLCRYRTYTPLTRKHDDLYIVEFPKSGVTWLSFIFANIMVLRKGEEDRVVNFYNIHDFVPDIHVSRDLNNNFSPIFGCRVIKSHASFNPYYKKIIYLWRDPFEVMQSYFRMLCGLNQYNGNFSEFVLDKRHGIDAWVAHVESWIYKTNPAQRIYFINYNELLKNTYDEVSDLLVGLGVRVNENLIRKAIEFSSKENMMSLEEVRNCRDLRRKNYLTVSKSYRFVSNEGSIEKEDFEMAYKYVHDKSAGILRIMT